MDNIERQKIHDRDLFNYEDREIILNKSHGKCCHCGKSIKIYKGMTVDHFIPLSKGGNNRMLNIVPLCKECNDEKDNKIVNPDQYLKYIDEKYLNEIRGYFESYIMSFEYVTRNNLLACDQYEFHVYPPSILGGTYNKSFKKAVEQTKIPILLKKATDNDFERIFEYYANTLKKHGELDSMTAANKNISFWMRFGSIYYIERNGNIQTMACVTMQDFPDYEEMEKEYDDGVNKSFVMILFSYYSTEMVEIITEALARELPDIIMKERNLESIPVNIQFLEKDKMGCRVASNLGKTFVRGNMIQVNVICTKDGKDPKRVDSDEDLQKFFAKFKDVSKDIELWFSIHDPNGEYTWMADDIIWNYSYYRTHQEDEVLNEEEPNGSVE